MTDSLNKQSLSEVLGMSTEKLSDLFGERSISIPVSALHTLKRELVYSIGENRTKGVFIRYGWHTGVSEGEKVRNLEWNSQEDLVRAGPLFHIMRGHVDGVTIKDIKYDEAGAVKHIEVVWHNSYEAEEQIEFQGESKTPACHTLCGFASGYLSSALNVPMLVKETKCRAMGHDHCEVVCKPIESWGLDEQETTYYQSSSMVEELDHVTAKLKEERDYLSIAQSVHKRLIEFIISKKEFQKIIELLHDTTGLSMFFEDEQSKIIARTENLEVDFDLQALSPKTTEFFEISSDTGLLRSPIYFESKVRGYCTFIYKNGDKPNQLEYNIIDQASLISSIILLHENIKMQTSQNIRRSFLTDILDNKLEDDELYKIANYLNLDPDGDYWMFTLEKSGNEDDLNHEVEVNEAVLRHISLFFTRRGMDEFAAQKSGKLVIALEAGPNIAKKADKTELIKQLIRHCKAKFMKYKFYVGVSSVENNIRCLPKLFKETEIALNTKTDNNDILYYETLGVERIIFQVSDQDMLKSFVDDEIGRLLEEDKHDELVTTLRYYIENGMNINATSKAMAMSISGLRYRLEKISEVLGVELDDTKSLFSKYMALNVLKRL